MSDEIPTTPAPEPATERNDDDLITMTFNRVQWGRIYDSVKNRGQQWDKKTQLETWIAYEEIRLAMLERL